LRDIRGRQCGGVSITPLAVKPGWMIPARIGKEGSQICKCSTREEIKRRMDELGRQYVESRNREIIEELYRLSRELKKLERQ
jgi:hypothetical protein